MGISAQNNLGNGQNWQNVTGSRSAGVTYYNTSGRSILVNVSLAQLSTSNVQSELKVNGVVVANSSQSGGAVSAVANTMTALIPIGGSYLVTSFLAGLLSWVEMK